MLSSTQISDEPLSQKEKKSQNQFVKLLKKIKAAYILLFFVLSNIFLFRKKQLSL